MENDLDGWMDGWISLSFLSHTCFITFVIVTFSSERS